MRVLFINDSPTLGRAAILILKHRGIAVDYAENNVDAISFLYAGNSYHAIVQDVERPPDEAAPNGGMRAGIAFYHRYILTICPSMPVIFYTGCTPEQCFSGEFPPTCSYLSRDASLLDLEAILRSVVECAEYEDDQFEVIHRRMAAATYPCDTKP